MTCTTISAEQYTRALAAAERDGVQVVSITGSIAEVFSAHSIKAYTVEIGADHMTCNCQAVGYCKHRAAVRRELVARALAVTPVPTTDIVARCTRCGTTGERGQDGLCCFCLAALLHTEPVRRGPLADSTPRERAKFSIFK